MHYPCPRIQERHCKIKKAFLNDPTSWINDYNEYQEKERQNIKEGGSK
jgi:hypothetical protein